MLPVHQQRVRFRKAINVHLQMRRQAFGIPAPKINKTRLPAAGAALAALKIRHKKRDSRPEAEDANRFYDGSSPE